VLGRLSRAPTIVACLAAAGAAGWAFGRAPFDRWIRTRALLRTIDAGSYAGTEFRPEERTLYRQASRIDFVSEPSTCWMAVGAAERGQAHLRAEHGAVVTEADRALVFCNCDSERVSVQSSADHDLPSAVKLLRAPAASVGGLHGLSITRPDLKQPGPETIECSTEHLDAWIGARRHPVAKGDLTDSDPRTRALEQAGLRAVARLGRGLPFVVVEGAADSCFLAADSEAAGRLALQFTKGARPLQGERALAWCGTEARAATVWRDGEGEVTIFAAKSASIGGLLGLREAAARAGLGAPQAWIRKEDLARDAHDTLVASGAADARIVISGDDPPQTIADERIVAVSVASGGMILPEGWGEVPHVCAPELGKLTSESVCVEARPQSWRAGGAPGLVGAAAARLPFWMTTFGSVDEPRGLDEQLALLGLMRRLFAQRFTPTVVGDITELASGIELTGRDGEDAVVAVGVSARSPWAFPYTDGPAWKLGDEPRVIPLAAGQRVKLTARPQPAIPVGERRTVVFRRAAR
jgi:hypothetical protein